MKKEKFKIEYNKEIEEMKKKNKWIKYKYEKKRRRD